MFGTLDSQNYSLYIKYLPGPEAQTWVRFTLRIAVPRYKVVKTRKCTKWPQSELERLTVKTTPYTLKNYPEAQILVLFAKCPAVSNILQIL